jgi:uncharacterized membrane protein YraQ (UPF0718 family)
LIKIGILILIINYIMAITRYYFPMEKVRDILTKRRWFGLDYLFAALLGIVTPFCSCSSIPLFIGFVGAGIPLGVTFAFLIASPLLNEASIYLFPAMFGLKVVLIYNILGIIISMAAGMLIQRMKMDKYVRQEFLTFKTRKQIQAELGNSMTLRNLVPYWWREGLDISKKIFPYVVLGVGIGALIHGFVPSNFFEQYLASTDWWSVPVAVLLGAPLYANSIAVIPIVEALIDKGVPIGTALAFMASIVAISFPELLILKKVMRWQLLAAFIIIAMVGITIMGYILNYVI